MHPHFGEILNAMKNCVRAGVMIVVLGVSCVVAKGQASLAQGPFTQKELPWSVSGFDRAPDGTVYMVSDVDNALYRYVLTETLVHNRSVPMLVKKSEPIALPVTYSGGERKSGLESVRYINDTTFLFSTEYDKAGSESASALYLGKLRGTKMSFTEIIPDKCFQGTWTNNSGIEGVTITPDHKSIWIVNERPFKEDVCDDNRRFVRLARLSFSGEVLEQFVYALQPSNTFTEPGAFTDNGVSEILMYDDTHILLLERAFGGVETCRTYGRVFMLDLTRTRATSDCESRIGSKAIDAKLLFDAGATFSQAHIDNYEGLTWGPVKDGKRTLMLISDDNGNWTKHACPQTTDLILLSIK